MVAEDILKVLMCSRGNQYILVAQDYFSKWPFARAIPDQKAETIVRVLKDEISLWLDLQRNYIRIRDKTFRVKFLVTFAWPLG